MEIMGLGMSLNDGTKCSADKDASRTGPDVTLLPKSPNSPWCKFGFVNRKFLRCQQSCFMESACEDGDAPGAGETKRLVDRAGGVGASCEASVLSELNELLRSPVRVQNTLAGARLAALQAAMPICFSSRRMVLPRDRGSLFFREIDLNGRQPTLLAIFI